MVTKYIARRYTELLTRVTFAPLLAELERETGTRIKATLLCLIDRQPVAYAEYREDESIESAAVAEVRIVLAESFRVDLFSFSCQAIVRGLAPSSGYAGFSMNGKVDLATHTGEVHVKRRISHYNQWEWKREYAVQ